VAGRIKNLTDFGKGYCPQTFFSTSPILAIIKKPFSGRTFLNKKQNIL